MSNTITQTRLSMRLDAYLRKYTGKMLVPKAEWERVWRVADVARTRNTLTPELVDDVRKALKELETAREMPL